MAGPVRMLRALFLPSVSMGFATARVAGQACGARLRRAVVSDATPGYRRKRYSRDSEPFQRAATTSSRSVRAPSAIWTRRHASGS